MKDLNQRPVPAAITQLRAEIKQLPRGKGGGVGAIPKELKRRIAKVWEQSEMSASDLAVALAVGKSSVWRWCQRSPKKGRVGATKKSAVAQPIFKKVRVLQDAAPSQGHLTLEGPGGTRLSGLSLDDVAKLWKALC